MRFYKHDGWTEEILLDCLGKPENQFLYWPEDRSPYWVAKSWNCFDLDKLAAHVTVFETYERRKITDKSEILLYLEDNN